MIPSHEPESGYYQTHNRVREYFQGLASQQASSVIQGVDVQQAPIEEAYHALALGDPKRAVELALVAQSRNLTLWEPLLEAVQQAPTELMPADAEQRAYAALVQAEQHHYARDAVTALVFYTWLLSASRESPTVAARIENNLGNAYRDLPGGDRDANLKHAIACYEAALEVRTREAFPVDWAMTQNNLGNAYSDLPGGDREANLRQAIACYEAALEVRTREAFPVDWAMTQNNLGTAYSNLPGGDREANLKQAIACYEAALEV